MIPGLIDTPLTWHEERYAQILEDAGKEVMGSPNDENTAQQILKTKTALGVPWIYPEDVALVVVFLASEVAHMVSGATYEVTSSDSCHFSRFESLNLQKLEKNCRRLLQNALLENHFFLGLKLKNFIYLNYCNFPLRLE